MIKEVREQAKVFADILRTRSKIADVARELSKRNPRSYYAVGCGSSYYAAMIGIFYHEYVFGLDSRALPSSEFVWYTPVNSPPSVLMALSRSGKTSETVGATRKARKMQIPTVAITSEPTSTMGTECDYCLNIQIGDEQSVVMTKSFTDVILAGVDKVPKSWSILGRTKAAGIFTAGSAGYVAQCYSKLGATSPSTTRS
ncbi:MAG: SIS domain-containing protein [Candidatus Bathyarchaeia archaeon]|jgi:glucosamine--fructose-6-phosphate aminotransferase (isomerizing)